MRTLLVAAILAAGPAVAGERFFREGGDEVRLYDSACQYASVLRFIPEQYRKDVKKATAKINGEKWFACYLESQEAIFLIYEDGDQGVLPASAFKDAPEA